MNVCTYSDPVFETVASPHTCIRQDSTGDSIWMLTRDFRDAWSPLSVMHMRIRELKESDHEYENKKRAPGQPDVP